MWPNNWGRRRVQPQMRSYPHGKRNFVGSKTFQKSLSDLVSEDPVWSEVVLPLMEALQESQEELIGREQEVVELMSEIAHRSYR